MKEPSGHLKLFGLNIKTLLNLKSPQLSLLNLKTQENMFFLTILQKKCLIY